RAAAAGPVFSNKDLLLDPHLRARGFYRRVPMHPRAERVDRRLQPGPAWQLSETPVEIRRGAPVIGQDNPEILVELLGRPAADLERLRAQGVLDTAPPANVAAPLRGLLCAIPGAGRMGRLPRLRGGVARGAPFRRGRLSAGPAGRRRGGRRSHPPPANPVDGPGAHPSPSGAGGRGSGAGGY